MCSSDLLRRAPQGEFDFRVDLNRAGPVELSLLPGVGPTLARRIAEDRDARGPFADVEDLGRVRGVGPRLLEQLRPRLTVGAPRPERPEEPAQKKIAPP